MSNSNLISKLWVAEYSRELNQFHVTFFDDAVKTSLSNAMSKEHPMWTIVYFNHESSKVHEFVSKMRDKLAE